MLITTAPNITPSTRGPSYTPRNPHSGASNHSANNTAGSDTVDISPAAYNAFNALMQVTGGKFASPQSVANVSSQPTANPEPSILSKIATKYDVRNMTSFEMADMSKELLQNGKITEPDYAAMNLDIAKGDLGTRFNNEFNSTNGNTDYMAMFQAEIAGSKRSGATNDLGMKERLFGLLKNIDALRTAQLGQGQQKIDYYA